MAILAAGAILQLNISGTYTSIAELTSIDGPDFTVADVDVTTLLSTGRWKEFLAGFKDGGTVSVEANYNSTSYGILFARLGNSAEAWKLILSNSSSITFSGHLTGLKLGVPFEEEVSQPWSIKVTGVPVFTA